MISKSDFVDWDSHPVTKIVKKEIAELIKEGMEELSHCAGENPITDSRRVGKLDGLRSLLHITFYDLEDKDVD